MAQYFARPTQPSVNPRHASLHNHSQPWTLDIGESSIYVFPNPPSDPPSPGQISTVSATEFSSSALSSSPSRDSSVPVSPADIPNNTLTPSPLSTPLIADLRGFDSEQWEWDALEEPAARSLLVGLEDATERPDRWEIIARRRALNQYLQSISTFRSSSISLRKGQQTSKPPTTSAVFTPHPRIQIPLLSFFVSLLSVDDGTLDLLTQSSSHSALFPGESIPPLEKDLSAAEREVENLHGVERLLMRESEARVLKDGLVVASDTSSNPLLASPFTGLWDIVSGLMTNGGKALREILQ
ncbi:hypothetical protein BDQ17DRAFT_1343064 [Cyathus striatus]|nr:hypothetical protein BDQ17DRAFT_1343064 [Cyathus striatus]